jgi:hypothetical protein
MLIFGVYALVTQKLGAEIMTTQSEHGMCFLSLLSCLRAWPLQHIEGLHPPGHLVTVVVLRGPNKWEIYFNDIVAWTFSCIISVRCLWLS